MSSTNSFLELRLLTDFVFHCSKPLFWPVEQMGRGFHKEKLQLAAPFWCRNVEKYQYILFFMKNIPPGKSWYPYKQLNGWDVYH